jgi:hypothetical protein
MKDKGTPTSDTDLAHKRPHPEAWCPQSPLLGLTAHVYACVSRSRFFSARHVS